MIDEKLLNKIRMLRRNAVSEWKLGNKGAAQTFSQAYKARLATNNLTKADIREKQDQKVQIINEVGKTIVINPFLRKNARTNLRQNWFEQLAKVIFENYNCKILVNSNGEITVLGFDYDREVASFYFERIAERAQESCRKEILEAKAEVGKPDLKRFGKPPISYPKVWMGDDIFVDSFHLGFREALSEIHNKNVQEFGLQTIKKEVVDFYESSKYVDGSPINSIGNSIHSLDPYSFNASAKERGYKAGLATAKKATKSPSALTTTKFSTNENDTVYLAIDCSSSMFYGSLDEAKQSSIDFAKEAIEEKNYSVGIISFSNSAQLVSKPVNKIDDKFEKAIEKMTASGCTNMAAAINLATARMTNKSFKRKLVVVTDGEPYTHYGSNATFETLEAARLAKRNGIEIIAIGVEGANEEFLKKLASKEELGMLTSGARLQLTMGELAKQL